MSGRQSESSHPKVFISYSHDSTEHCDRVLELSNALRSHGIDAEIDRYHIRPPKGWPHWCEEQLRPEKSRFVLVVCTATYRKRVEDKIPANEGRGVFWEGSNINDYLYSQKENTRFIPVLLPGSTEDDIPIPLHGTPAYCITTFDLTDAGYNALYRELTDQPEVIMPPLGEEVELSPLPIREARSSFPPPMIASKNLFNRKALIVVAAVLVTAIGAVITIQYWHQPRISPQRPAKGDGQSEVADSQTGGPNTVGSHERGKEDKPTPMPTESDASSPPITKRSIVITIEITVVPPNAQSASSTVFPIGGGVRDENPADHKVVIYAYDGRRWWVQPMPNAPLTDIREDGQWQTETHSGSRYAALLVKRTYRTKATLSTLPKVEGDVLAIDRKPPELPRIRIMTVSPIADSVDGKAYRISGAMHGVHPTECRVVVYAFDGRLWHVQPDIKTPWTEIAKDGSWSTKTGVGVRYAALLVRDEVVLPNQAGRLPELGSDVLALDEKKSLSENYQQDACSRRQGRLGNI